MEINKITKQLTIPFILLGDFSAHNVLWTINKPKSNRSNIENLIQNYNPSLLNDKANTYIHQATGTMSILELTICSPSLFLDLHVNCGSGHFPICIEIVKLIPEERTHEW